MSCYKDCDASKGKRRSSFFQRRRSLHLAEINCISDSIQLESNESVNREDNCELTLYLNKLKLEKEDWKKALREIKKENVELKDLCSQVVENNWDFLTVSDREFLEDRPDYVNVGRLLDGVAEVIAVRQRQAIASHRKLESLVSDVDNNLHSSAAAVIHVTINYFTEIYPSNE